VHVGLVCPYSLTVPGGVQAQVLGLARSLRTLGHDARVFAPCDGAPPDAGITPLGRSVPLAANGSIAPLAPDLPCALRTIRVLADEDLDVVHLHEPLVPGPTLTTLLFTELPTVGTFHRAGASTAYAILRPAVRYAARKLGVRCAVSEDAAATATAALGGEYEVVFNGIEVTRFAKADPWPTSGPTILFVGRHEPRKGLDVLIDAMDRLPAATRLWVAGNGEQTPELRTRTQDDPRVEWLGSISEDEKMRRLRGADVFCAPSLHGESFGVVLLEAMAAQTAIVASDIPGYRRVARPDADALLVPPGDADALAGALCRVLDDSGLAGRLVESGDARAWSFSMDSLAELYVEKYDLAVGRARAAAVRGGRRRR
jgi:phosphatidylinositol alpha-mannosyltransferase